MDEVVKPKKKGGRPPGKTVYKTARAQFDYEFKKAVRQFSRDRKNDEGKAYVRRGSAFFTICKNVISEAHDKGKDWKWATQTTFDYTLGKPMQQSEHETTTKTINKIQIELVEPTPQPTAEAIDVIPEKVERLN